MRLSVHGRARRRRLLRNILLFIPCLFLISLLAFAVLYYSPGDAAMTLLRSQLDRTNVTAEQAAAYAEKIGYDRSFPSMYFSWAKGLLRGDFGYSPSLGGPALPAFWQKFRITLMLALISAAVEVVVALALGFWAAFRPGGFTDRTVGVWSVLTFSMPSFWAAMLVVWLLTMKCHMQWVIGYTGVRSLVVPACVMGLLSAGQMTRLIRKQAREVLMAPFVDFAKAQGLKPGSILLRHVLPHVLPMVIAVLVMDLSAFIGGALLVEAVFNIPGFSRFLEEAIRVKDFALLSTSLFLTAAFVSGLNLLADALYPKLDARNRNELLGRDRRPPHSWRRTAEAGAVLTGDVDPCRIADTFGEMPGRARRGRRSGDVR